MADAHPLLEPLLALHDAIRDRVVEACTRETMDALAGIAGDDAGDTIYRIDRVSEEMLVEGLLEVAQGDPLCLVAEGLPGGKRVLPNGAREGDCRWRLLVDPIDGTRGLMYQKRSAWILTGVAPDTGDGTRLRDIELAVQTEIPLVKQHLSDQLWARRGHGMHARRFDRLTRTTRDVSLRPSRAESIAHGFATVVRFFSGARDILGALDDDIVRELVGQPAAGKALCFEDQYASTGGQLYELIAGHDRFIADLRPLVLPLVAKRGLERMLCCHPYDICTALIAEEAGVAITDARGQPVDGPFDIDADVSWVGYANDALRRRVEPVLQAALRRHGLMPAGASIV